MTEHRLLLPFLPLSVNDSLRPAKLPNGQVRLVSTREAEKSKAAIRELAALLKPLPVAPLELHLTVWVPTLAHDGSNREKGLTDALKGLALEDDKFVARWIIEKRIDTEGDGRALVVVRLADPATVDPELLARIVTAQKRATREERRAGESGPPVRARPAPKKPKQGRELRSLLEQLATPNVVRRVRACARCSRPAFTSSPWCLTHAPAGSLP